ncbi:MAG: hypothetical protein J7K75_13650 [Desulfuromonas sp.]|nr:hypothetical protein [Desulfuromonas sp.]
MSTLNPFAPLRVALVFKAISLHPFFGALQRKGVGCGTKPANLILQVKDLPAQHITATGTEEVRVSPRQATSFLKAAKKEAKIGFFISVALRW